MGCSEPTEDDEDAATFPIRNSIGGDQAMQLLYLQYLLMQSGLRGDARHIAEWVECDFLSDEVRTNTEAIGIFVSDRHLDTAGSNPLELLTGNYGSMKGLDDGDFLRNEIANREISGTCCAIDDQKILTAGHVLGDQERRWLEEEKLYVLFGFATRIDGQTQTVFDPMTQLAKVVRPHGVDLKYSFKEEWLILDIDRSILKYGGRRHAILSDVPLEDWAPVYTLGHPNGLSLRYASSPFTVPGPEETCFRAFVEGYGGASGSPVFDARSHRIVGIAVASGQKLGTVKILDQGSLSQVCTPLTSAGVSCLRRPSP
jgi:hypothetical protein